MVMPIFGIGFPIGVMLLIGFISKPEAKLLGFSGVVAVGICATGFMGSPSPSRPTVTRRS
jgi:hypothetical protein